MKKVEQHVEEKTGLARPGLARPGLANAHRMSSRTPVKKHESTTTCKRDPGKK